MKYVILGIFFCLSIFGCAQSQAAGSNPITPPAPELAPEPEKGVKVILAAMGASWCSACKRAIPQLQDELDKLSKSDRNLIEFRLYCEDESKALCEKYRDQLKIKAEAFPDAKWKLFRAWIGNSLVIPAAAILNSDSTKVLKAFPASTTFLAKEIVEHALKKAKE